MKWLNGSQRKDLHWQRTPLSPNAFAGKRIAVIGGTNGIGRAIAHELVTKGAEVTVLGRTFRDQDVAGLHFVPADLAQLKQAQRVAQELPVETLDMLIFTTGILAGKQRLENSEGIEMDLAVSYLSRFVMVRETVERLGTNRAAADAKPRVFIVGFPGTNQKGCLDDFNSENQYNLMTAHSNTVIGNEALVLDSASRYPQVNFYGLNPGLIKSNIRAGVLGEGTLGQKIVELLIGSLFQSVEEYSKTIVPLLISPDLERHSGAMFNRHGDPIYASSNLKETSNLKKVIQRTEELVRKAFGQ
jgi:NAD(P)-dependent dehydrogenase (short-subunit alcohol dehydrogenase family)